MWPIPSSYRDIYMISIDIYYNFLIIPLLSGLCFPTISVFPLGKGLCLSLWQPCGMELTPCRSVECCGGGGGHLVEIGHEAGQGKSGALGYFTVLHIFSSNHE